MKKLSYLFIAIISFIGINSVNADTLQWSSFYDNFDISLEFYNSSSGSSVYEHILSIYEEKYASDYPYYYFVLGSAPVQGNYYTLTMFYSSSRFEFILLNNSEVSLRSVLANVYTITYDSYYQGGTYYDYHDATYGRSYGIPLSSNFPLVYVKDNQFDVLSLPSFSSSSFDFSSPSFTISSNDYIPNVLDLYNGTYEKNIFEHYTEINLNNYSYVALSLKDYTLRNDNINQFFTNIYTKGQLCLTPVYDYGMKEKTEYYSGYQVDRCSVVYDDFTPVRTYVLKQDLENNAIYYLKAYDTNIENKVKVDNSIFDITYITSENANNPSVSVNGRNYPTIAYDDLSSSSTQSEEEGYVSGQSPNVLDQFDDNFINNFFSNPLNILKSVWGAITSMLTLVATFIGLLPPTLQGFLYMSFALAIILGIIKILL